jgi:hypothetical protein
VSSARGRGLDFVQDLTEVLDALARAQLLARRVGASIEIKEAPSALAQLIRDAGLASVLPVDVYGQIEQRKQCGIDEEVDAGDATL